MSVVEVVKVDPAGLVTLKVEIPSLAWIASQMKTHAEHDLVTQDLLAAFAEAATEYLNALIGEQATMDGITLTVSL